MSNKIVLPIDVKSLYYNIKNDNVGGGHTATVNTIIKQGNSVRENLMKIYDIPETIDFEEKPRLVDELIKNSKTRTKITKMYSFKSISVNGNVIDMDNKSFGIYIKEEVDDTKFQFGRVKFHYPLSLKYIDEDIDIDNKYVMNKISQKINDYAFIVNAFEYDTDKRILNFDIIVIGENDIPYSKVFINNKGVGNKFTNIFNENAESYDMEIISLKNRFGQEVSPNNYRDYMEKASAIAFEKCEELFKEKYDNYKNIKEIYPYSLYDYEVRNGYEKKYIIAFYTTTEKEYFNISSKKLKFINDFEKESEIILVTSVFNEPKITQYSVQDILNFSKSINSLMLRKDN